MPVKVDSDAEETAVRGSQRWGSIVNGLLWYLFVGASRLVMVKSPMDD